MTSNTQQHPGITGTLYIISAPSGAGKTSLVKSLVESASDVEVSISYTTRAPRPGEQEGQHYHFVEKSTFDNMVKKGVFLEYAQVFDNFYGTSKEKVLEKLQQGIDVILEIDWQGARQARAAFADNVGIFILPPSRSVLETRLRSRGQDDEQVIARRMRDAKNEISHYNEFDYIIVNDVFEQAMQDLHCVIRAHRLMTRNQSQKQAFLINDLLA